MSDEFGFAPPPFKADEALAMLKRHLRDMRLLERAGRFEWKGDPLVELTLEDGAIRARTVKRPARSPEWTVKLLKSAADVRHYTEEFKRQFARWSDSDD
ncbi:hypothetical protein [uncultured Methylibium sp.]|uniref:hypothetical protein n=1 Tax=uncultured Methylibium sp. TaxID=381093 RepID=UPI0025E6BA99|nr:hypothetical protein [uncultured Methylibium sp.]